MIQNLEKYDVEIYDGDIDISGLGLTSLPFKKLKRVNGDFYCSNNQLLISLKGLKNYKKIYIDKDIFNRIPNKEIILYKYFNFKFI